MAKAGLLKLKSRVATRAAEVATMRPQFKRMSAKILEAGIPSRLTRPQCEVTIDEMRAYGHALRTNVNAGTA